MFYCRNCKSQVMAGQSVCPVCGCDVVDNYETVCSTCGTHNRGGSRFCSSCGGILPLIKRPICVICGTQNVPGAKFCCSCGGPMLMAEETHSREDIIEQRKQKMRADLIAKEKLKEVDEEIFRRREKISEEELKSRDIIIEREKECDDLIIRKAEKLAEYKKKLEEADSPDVAKLKKLAKAVRTYSSFLFSPFSELPDVEKRNAIFVCPVCGAENSLNDKACYACGRSKERSLELMKKGKLIKYPNYGVMNHRAVRPKEKIDISDVGSVVFENAHDNVVSQFKQSVEEKSQNTNIAKGEERQYQQHYQNDFQAPHNFYRPQNGQIKFAPSFSGANNPTDPYQMPPIVQPVAFVPYVTQDQPVLQFAQGNELKNKLKEKND
ncbi:MAG TPA: hypothetical protein VJZ69_04805 [Clostridia bacterium]|nr:hypothetical protein [Clostridia bacterium]